jgi:hypothetical protein
MKAVELLKRTVLTDEVTIAPDESGYALNITGVYQGRVTLDWVMQTCHCATQMARAGRVQNSWLNVSAICHAPWELISAGLVRGRTLTSCHTIQDDIRNAGGNWVDKEVVEGRNWVTSRNPRDLPAFNRAIIGLSSQNRSVIHH